MKMFKRFLQNLEGMLFLHPRTLQALSGSVQKYISDRPTVSNMNPLEVDSDEDDNCQCQ